VLAIEDVANDEDKRFSLAMGTPRRSAVEENPEAGDRTWMRHWRAHRPAIRGGQRGSLALAGTGRG
jgi:hypothetical protein